MRKMQIGRIVFFGLFCLFAVGCSAGNRAPTDQLIQGPFTVVSDWQTIQFERPLMVLPHIHQLRFLFSRGKYKETGFLQQTEHRIVSGSLFDSVSEVVIEPQVILIDRTGKSFETVLTAVGHWKIEAGHFDFLGFGVNSKAGKFSYPKGTEFVAARVKSNVEVRAEHLYWFAYSYVKAPGFSWADVKPSEIVELK